MKSFMQLIFEVVQNESDYIHQIVLLTAVDGTDRCAPVHILYRIQHQLLCENLLRSNPNLGNKATKVTK